MNSQKDFTHNLNTFYDKYRNPTDKLFLERNIDIIYEQSKTDAQFNPATKEEIKQYSNVLENLSRNREKRILRGRKRHLNFRKWKTYGPKNILLGDLAFLRDIKGKNNKRYIVLVLLDAFR